MTSKRCEMRNWRRTAEKKMGKKTGIYQRRMIGCLLGSSGTFPTTPASQNANIPEEHNGDEEKTVEEEVEQAEKVSRLGTGIRQVEIEEAEASLRRQRDHLKALQKVHAQTQAELTQLEQWSILKQKKRRKKKSGDSDLAATPSWSRRISASETSSGSDSRAVGSW